VKRWEPSFLRRLTPGARAALAVVGALVGMGLIFVGVGSVARDEAPAEPTTSTTVVQGSN
jgi:hypothetical protein